MQTSHLVSACGSKTSATHSQVTAVARKTKRRIIILHPALSCAVRRSHLRISNPRSFVGSKRCHQATVFRRWRASSRTRSPIIIILHGNNFRGRTALPGVGSWGNVSHISVLCMFDGIRTKNGSRSFLEKDDSRLTIRDRVKAELYGNGF